MFILFQTFTKNATAQSGITVKEQVVSAFIASIKANVNITSAEQEKQIKQVKSATSLSDLAKLAERWKYNDILKEINRLLEKQGAVSRPMTPAETQELARQQREQLANILGAQDDVKERDRENSRKGNAFWKAA
ncbi:MAG: hypothetical protein WC588_02810 [Candidatus Micrarchaeia archaeon]